VIEIRESRFEDSGSTSDENDGDGDGSTELSEYAFGGSVLGVTTDELGQQVELEAMWSLSF
jgi:hypothetical protein